MATELKNKQNLIDMCLNVKGEKTKSKFVLSALRGENYERRPHSGILDRDGLKARVQIIGMCGMLECANNFKYGYGGADCKLCGVVDDEDHRINMCPKYGECNLYQSQLKYDFGSIHSDDVETVDRTIEVVMHIWNLKNGKNEMK